MTGRPPRTEPSRWDVNRQKKKGTPTAAPRCSTCGAASVYDPCRDCAPVEAQPATAPSLFGDG
jgi:hypothetical protein